MNEALHTAIVQALTAALPVAVYGTQPPQDTPAPFVVVGDIAGDAWDTSDSDGAKATVEVVVNSDYRGSAEALAIADMVRAALGHGESLDLQGAAALVDLWASLPSTDTLDDGRTTRATVRVSVLLDDIAPIQTTA